MGCPSSKNSVAVLEDSSDLEKNSTIENSDETIDEDFQNKNPKVSYPPAEAFVISLEETYNPLMNGEASSAAENYNKKPPPKRLLELVGQAQAPSAARSPESIVVLQAKLDEAEIRRHNFLQQKIHKIQKTIQVHPKNNEANLKPTEQECNGENNLEQQNN